MSENNYKYRPETKEELIEAIKREIYEVQGSPDKPNWKADLSNIDTSKITDMRNLFSKEYELEKFNGNINEWDVSNVKFMSSMFEGSQFNQPLDKWNTNSVEYMNCMFKDSLFSQNISKWNIDNVEEMKEIFKNSPLDTGKKATKKKFEKYVDNAVDKLSSRYRPKNKKELIEAIKKEIYEVQGTKDNPNWNADLNYIDTSLIDDMSFLFSGDYGLNKFNGDISKWNTENVTNMRSMFAFSEFNGNINDWDTGRVTNMNTMFYKNKAFNGDISEWNTSSVRAMYAMFEDSAFNNKSIGNWNVNNVEDMGNMLKNSPIDLGKGKELTKENFKEYMSKDENKTEYKYQPKTKEELVEAIKKEIYEVQGTEEEPNWEADLNNIDTSLIEDMSHLFSKEDKSFIGYGLYKFNGDISKWNTSKVENMAEMFKNSKFNQPIGEWDVSNVKIMNSMFNNSIFNHPLNNWNTSSVEDMNSMFAYSEFNQPIGNWNITNVWDMDEIFAYSEFNQPLNDWDVSNIDGIENIFKHSKLTYMNKEKTDNGIEQLELMSEKADDITTSLNNINPDLLKPEINEAAEIKNSIINNEEEKENLQKLPSLKEKLNNLMKNISEKLGIKIVNSNNVEIQEDTKVEISNKIKKKIS